MCIGWGRGLLSLGNCSQGLGHLIVVSLHLHGTERKGDFSEEWGNLSLRGPVRSTVLNLAGERVAVLKIKFEKNILAEKFGDQRLIGCISVKCFGNLDVEESGSNLDV